MENTYKVLEGLSARPSDRFASETNDCTVNAISNVTRQPYPVVHAYLKAAGRKDRRGFRTYGHFGQSRVALGHKFTYLNLNGSGSRSTTVARFAKTHRSGRFLVCIARHALCVVDGTIVDSARVKPRARIRSAWRVEPVGAAPTTPAVALSIKAPARSTLKMAKVARGHFKTTVPVSVTQHGVTVRRLADLEILSGRYNGGLGWHWRLSLHLPGETVVQSERCRSLGAGKALFADPFGAHRNWTHTFLRGWTPTGSY